MVTLSVRLNDEELEGLRELIEIGRYKSRSEAIGVAIELLLFRLSEVVKH